MSHGLEDNFYEKVKQLIMGVEISTGLDWVVTSGRRTMAEQQRLYDQGRKSSGPIVTKAPPGSSAHNFGLAADLCPMKDGKPWWNAPDEVWKQMADVAIQLGLTAGYYFKSIHDAPHVESPSWKEQQALWKAGKIQIA
jgi:peptidoglycan L-alanyl-D-glutamate endopeptidase CwlK